MSSFLRNTYPPTCPPKRERRREPWRRRAKYLPADLPADLPAEAQAEVEARAKEGALAKEGEIRNTKAAGFTLIESLLVVGIFAFIALVSTQVLFSALKGGIKSEVEANARQNGSFALSIITQMVRNSTETKACTAASRCYIGSTPYSAGVQITNPDGHTTLFHCISVTGDSYIASNAARLTGDSVSITDCNITASPTASPTDVNVSFTVSTNTTSTRPEEKESDLPFSARISLRNN